MKKICLFSTKATKSIEGAEAELYFNFYLVLNKDYIFTFLIEAPDLACSDRHPIKLWKHFLMLLEEETVKYERRYEECRKVRGKSMDFSYKSIIPFQDYRLSKEDKAMIDGMRQTAYVCGYRGGDVEFAVHQALKRMGRYDLLPPCERGESEDYASCATEIFESQDRDDILEKRFDQPMAKEKSNEANDAYDAYRRFMKNEFGINVDESEE